MSKVLLVATVQSHIAQFHKPLIELLKEHGCEVHVAAKNNLSEKNGLTVPDVDKIFDIPFSRKPANSDNIKAYKQLKDLVDREGYDVIHCNTPVGGVLGRLAARKCRKKGTKVIYTAHGFHFYRGGPKKHWMVYYPIEKIMSHYTDKLVTICDEDYQLASKKFKTEVCRIHGVGVDATRYCPADEEQKQALKQEMGFEKDSRLILCVGELLPNKNQIMAIRAMAGVVKQFPTAILLLAGNGPCRDELQSAAEELGISDNVRLLGYVTDLERYQKIADLSVSCSIREGLGLNIIEAMLCGNAVVATKNRGHCELVADGESGYLVNNRDVCAMENRIAALLKDNELSERMGNAGKSRAVSYSVERVRTELINIYGEELKG